MLIALPITLVYYILLGLWSLHFTVVAKIGGVLEENSRCDYVFTCEHWPHRNMLLLHEDFLAEINGRAKSTLKFQNFWIKDKIYLTLVEALIWRSLPPLTPEVSSSFQKFEKNKECPSSQMGTLARKSRKESCNPQKKILKNKKVVNYIWFSPIQLCV